MSVTFADVQAFTMLESLRDLLAPQRCLGCGSPAASWCSSCARLIRSVRWQLSAGVDCIAAANGTPLMMQTIALWKDGGNRSLTSALAQQLWIAIAPTVDTDVDLMILPDRSRSLRKRGYSPMQALAGELAAYSDRLHYPAASRLGWQRHPREQRGLSDAQRRDNVSGAMRLVGRGSRPVLIIDDVLTSGASLSEAVDATLHAGIPIVATAVLCSSRARRQGDSRAGSGQTPTQSFRVAESGNDARPSIP